MMDDEIRRRELGDFLRKRRENIDPVNVGLGRSTRRRTPGLRREEVAVLAGMSPTWYTYLEQARIASPSPKTVSILANLFGLSDYERIYLSKLTHTGPEVASAPVNGHVDQQLWQQLTESLDPIPAFVSSRFGDVLSWNHALTGWYTDFSRLPADRRNLLIWLFTEPEAGERFPDWAAEARAQVAHLRRASAEWYGAARLKSLIIQLQEASPQFTTWWNEHDVHTPATRLCQIRHARTGIATLRLVELWTDTPDPAKLVIHLPAHDHPQPR
jgi:transcriptional regulator with XRE-family HTH domain